MDPGSSETRVRSVPSHPLDAGGFAPGTILVDRYRIVSLAGRGGMGEVYRADDLKLGQPVALKFLPASLEHDGAARERLLAEVRSARTVSHPNVCRVYDVGEVDGRPFLTMEYIDGEDLASLLRRIGKLPAAKALEVARQLCAGLAAAHDKGLLHRDLKPANVMIDGRGQARITDFGLALRFADDVEVVAAGARHGVVDVAGTWAYMAPERFDGKPATVQSDLYALGLILYETYTGKPAFKADSFLDWQRAHSDSTPTNPGALATDVEPAVERAILRCLEKDPTHRPKSASQVAAALPGGDPLAAAIAAGETPSPELVAASGEEGTLPRRQAWAWFVACLVALAVLPFTLVPFSLSEHVTFELGPEALRTRAIDALQRLGYRDKPAGYAWWFRADHEELARINAMRPSEAASELRTAVPGPLRFCYRQSPAKLVPRGWPLSVNRTDPVPATGDVYVELDLGGRLLALRAMPPSPDEPREAGGLAWAPLLEAVQLGSQAGFVPAAPRWWPDQAFDTREAREGEFASQRVRVEAAARAGRVLEVRVFPRGSSPPANRGGANSQVQSAVGVLADFEFVVGWTCLAALGVLARRNLVNGRGDRRNALKLGTAMAVVMTLAGLLWCHSPTDALTPSLGPGLIGGLAAWVFYLAIEPGVRRAWPHLLISSTRLLEGRWRDPLVGRSLLAGVLGAVFLAAPWSLTVPRLLGLPSGGPAANVAEEYLLVTSPQFVSNLLSMFSWGLTVAGVTLGAFVVVRLVARRTGATWSVVALLAVAWVFFTLRTQRPTGLDSLFVLGISAFLVAVCGWVLWKHGALALAAAFAGGSLLQCSPWTLDMSRWFAWREWPGMAIVVGFAIWGFRNVLGKQSAFPAGALDG